MPQAAPSLLGSRRFNIQDQEMFGRLSGDTNPIHIDSVAARRSVVGAVVVHGMHAVLWFLEQLAQSPISFGDLSALDVIFPRPVYLGEEVSLRLQKNKGAELHLSAVVGEKTVASVRLTSHPLPQAAQEILDGVLLPLTTRPTDIAFEDLASQQGTVAYAVTVDDFATTFPNAAARFGAPLLRELAACSRLVGMDCPGQRSVFSRLTLEWRQRGRAAPLSYRVTETDSRFSMVTIAIQGVDVSGTIEAFCPQPSPRQLTLSELAERIAPNEFVGQTALIIGGSRGLGELTAKTITAGGGRVLITYAVGRDEARHVVDEIREFGEKADYFPYDATQPASAQLSALGAELPTHIYYYATCQIFRAKTQTFDAGLLDRFTIFYVNGFQDLCQALWDRGARRASWFYPSSIAVEDRPKGMTEYAMAKAAGEILATDLPDLFPGYCSYQLRLPRLLTDQTAVVSTQSLPSALEILFPLLQAMQRK